MASIAGKIIACLWFDNQAEEAAIFYTSVFPNAKMQKVVRTTGAGPGTAGRVLTASFEIEGVEFVGLNGGPHFKFTEAVSFQVMCEDQSEIDYFWDKLADGGSHSQCGWLKDRFGLSWQVVPRMLPKLLGGDGDAARAGRAMAAMMKMKKLDIAALQAA